MSPAEAAESFWSRVEKTDECWIWQGATKGNGYGHITRNRRNVLAHRYAYEMLVGAIPAGLHLDHLCRTTLCVRPDHLQPVTQAENNRRAAAVNYPWVNCKRGHPLSGDNLYVTSYGLRACITCRRAREQKYKEQRQAAAHQGDFPLGDGCTYMDAGWE